MRKLATPLVRKGRTPFRLMPSKSGLITGINAFRRHLFPRGPNSVVPAHVLHLSGAARVLRFRYPGTSTARSDSEEVELRVRAGISLVSSRDRLRNGETVVFHGRLLGRPLPAAGKLLALQARTQRGWRTFATPRARGADGRWAHRYRFTGTTATSRYEFRAVVPREGSYPYVEGESPAIHVVVYGSA